MRLSVESLPAGLCLLSALLLAVCGTAHAADAAAPRSQPHLGWQALDPPSGCRSVEGALISEDWVFARWRCADGSWLLLKRAVGRVGPQLLTRVVDELKLPALREDDYLLCVQGERPVLANTRDWEGWRAGRPPKALWVWGFDLERGRIERLQPQGMSCEFLDD